ncbi:MAG TPA: peptidoglycan bridge formation glycyltransferase FemA/FemB family protein [Terriglobales bacterium]|nr:peptidoglycan bridge formation glycyltransferase FemA/FemB family protein [Terriglobales bacterium]
MPFSDHCEPLLDAVGSEQRLLEALVELLNRNRLRYFEIRRLSPAANVGLIAATTSRPYYYHLIDLSPDLDTLFRNCHKDSTQRKIHRARREGLKYDEGSSQKLVNEFFQLQLITRHRHGLPPQPKAWFQNVVNCLEDSVKIRVAYQGSQAIAAILTVNHKTTMMYKYGCSDARFHNLGGMHMLFWRMIQEAKEGGFSNIDLGRSDPSGTGLITFKDRWGSTRYELNYSRCRPSRSPEIAYDSDFERRAGCVKRIISCLPQSITIAAGRLLYRHIG